jgi:hypothetical protein
MPPRARSVPAGPPARPPAHPPARPPGRYCAACRGTPHDPLAPVAPNRMLTQLQLQLQRQRQPQVAYYHLLLMKAAAEHLIALAQKGSAGYDEGIEALQVRRCGGMAAWQRGSACVCGCICPPSMPINHSDCNFNFNRYRPRCRSCRRTWPATTPCAGTRSRSAPMTTCPPRR